MDDIFDNNTTAVNVELDNELIVQLDELAEDSYVSRNDVIRGFLREQVDKAMHATKNEYLSTCQYCHKVYSGWFCECSNE